MPPGPNDPGTVLPPNPQPGLIASIGSIIAAVIGFGLPVIGIIASCIGIGFGIKGLRQGRAANYNPAFVCGIIGLCLSVLGIVFWVMVVLFESYR